MDVVTCYKVIRLILLLLLQLLLLLLLQLLQLLLPLLLLLVVPSLLQQQLLLLYCRHDVGSRRVEGDSGAGCAGGTGNAQLFARCPERHLGVVERRWVIICDCWCDTYPPLEVIRLSSCCILKIMYQTSYYLTIYSVWRRSSWRMLHRRPWQLVEDVYLHHHHHLHHQRIDIWVSFKVVYNYYYSFTTHRSLQHLDLEFPLFSSDVAVTTSLLQLRYTPLQMRCSEVK